ncbi:MAG: hypothetical protein ACI9R8_000396, partial [Candidatus Paceibacteria bacterium]
MNQNQIDSDEATENHRSFQRSQPRGRTMAQTNN